MHFDDAIAMAKRLGLAAHPEGGSYRETFRSGLEVNLRPDAARPASTAIYFLLPAGTFSAWHRVCSDEIWHHYDGDSVALHTLDPTGNYARVRLGKRWDLGEEPQRAVSAGVWQAAEPLGDRWALCGCTVAPGFTFADFELPTRSHMLSLFPEHRSILERLTRQ